MEIHLPTVVAGLELISMLLLAIVIAVLVLIGIISITVYVGGKLLEEDRANTNDQNHST